MALPALVAFLCLVDMKLHSQNMTIAAEKTYGEAVKTSGVHSAYIFMYNYTHTHCIHIYTYIYIYMYIYIYIVYIHTGRA